MKTIFTMKHLLDHNRRSALLFSLALLGASLYANNIQVSTGTLTAVNTAEGRANVRFDITWENSWRTSSAPGNWDAAWVFVKYRHATDGTWHHARLGSNAQHIAPVGSTLINGLLTPGSAFDAGTNWGVGAFLYRSTDGTGTFSANSVELRWNYVQNGITYADVAEVKVFAIEMVLVPQSSFYLGSGGLETNRFKNGTTNNPFQITSEAQLNMANSNGSLWAFSAIQAATLPASFPKGHGGFYCMKHEISQQQYVDFLNTLTRVQQNARTGSGINLSPGVTSVPATSRYVMQSSGSFSNPTWRSGIRCNATIPANAPITFYCDLNNNGGGGEANDGLWLACNRLDVNHLIAYLDWSGLRPMTELEYEKACRGPQLPTTNDYPWGSSSPTSDSNLSNSGAINEVCSNSSANFFSANNGPHRVGMFATAASTRAQAGAGYYGALDLGGNLHERVITVQTSDGRSYTGLHGDGALGATGAHDGNWPADSGYSIRGGAYADQRRVSDRSYNPNSGFNDVGGRGVRSVP